MDPKKLTYYYVEDDVKISTTRTSEQLKEVKAEVEDVVGEMKQGNFEPKSGMHCNWCDYKEVCPFAFKG